MLMIRGQNPKVLFYFTKFYGKNNKGTQRGLKSPASLVISAPRDRYFAFYVPRYSFFPRQFLVFASPEVSQ